MLRQTLAVAQASLFEAVEICGTSAESLAEWQSLSHGRSIRRVGSPERRAPTAIGRILSQLRWSLRVYRSYAQSNLRVINAHSVAVLPVAAFLARRTGARLVYDTHELETETSTSRGLQGRAFRVIEKVIIRRCDGVFVVNEQIKEWYERTYPGISVTSIVNVPDTSSDGARQGVDLRSHFSIPNESRIYVHVGNLAGARYIAEIIRVFIDRSEHLVFLGDGPLAAEVQRAANTSPHIHHHRGVDSQDVVATLRSADVGICLIEPSCLSYRLSLPNKAIEYISAGIPFVHNTLPAVRQLLDGRLASFHLESPGTELGVTLDLLTNQDIGEGAAALITLLLPSWSAESERMLEEYRRILGIERSASGDTP